jgi:hypothetical protein
MAETEIRRPQGERRAHGASVMLFLSLDEVEPPRPSATYETVRVLDIQRLRRALRRRDGRAAEIVERLSAEPTLHIVAVDWRSAQGPRIDYSLFGDTVLVNGDLSRHWEETKLAEPALEVIARALAVQARIGADYRDLGEI